VTDTRPRRLPPAERRTLIEDAAAHVFARDGYEAARLEDIAAAAGVTKPMIYRHFASKKALHMALLTRHRDALGMTAVTAFMRDTTRPLTDRIDAMLDAWFAYVEQHPYVGPLLFRNTATDPDVRTLVAELHAQQRAADVALFHEAGADVPPHLEQPLAEVVRSSLTGLALWWADHPETPRADLIAAMHRVLDGIAPPPERHGS
jgi:AcrR family transcriptional regulator